MLVFSRNVPVMWTEIREHIEIIDSNKLSGWENIKKTRQGEQFFGVQCIPVAAKPIGPGL